MSAIQAFNDFMNATGPVYITGPETIVNESVERNYLWGELVKGYSEAIQGGNEIRDNIILDDSDTFVYFQPNDEFKYANPQVTDVLRAPWRFANDHKTWTDQEVELNAPDGMGRNGLKTAYMRLARVKEQRLATSIVNGLERSITRPAIGNSAQMEVLTGKLPYSIPAFIHENLISTPDGFRGGAPLGWSTILGLDPSTDWRFTNQHVFYGSNLESTPNAGGTDITLTNQNAGAHKAFGLIAAMDEMWLRLDYTPPSTMGEYFEKSSIRAQKIVTSRAGITLYKRMLRDSNDRLMGASSPQDPAYTSPVYSGIPLTYMSKLDKEAIYPRASGTVANTKTGRDGATAITTSGGTEDGLTTIDKGARFYFINGSYMCPYIHSRRYLVQHEVIKHPSQPYTHVQNTDCWWNLMTRSRQRHGIVSPVRTAD